MRGRNIGLDGNLIKLIPELSLIRMNGHFFQPATGHFIRGCNSAISVFTSHLSGGKLLKIRICSSRSKFFSLKAYPFWSFFYIGQANKCQKY